MTVSAIEFLKASYNATRLLGDKAVASDAVMVIDGFESMALLTKQFPWPITSTQGEIEFATPLGGNGFQPQQLKIAHQGPINFMETVAGQVADFCAAVAARGGRFDATVYEGSPDKFTRGLKIRDCFVQLDDPDRDWESRAQILLVTGTLFFHYFGEKIVPNAVG